MMWGDWTMQGFGMWGGIMMFVFWIAVIVGVVLLVKCRKTKSSGFIG